GGQEELATRFHVTAVGPFWKVVRSEAQAPITAYSFVESEPGLFERYFISGTEPHREIVPDPYLTWELRTHFDQPAAMPDTPPVTRDQKRIAHNIAVARGDTASAAALRGELEAALRPIHATFDDGTELVAVRYEPGARPLLTMLFRAAGPL